MFASKYLANENLPHITTTPDNRLSGVVVIPCYSEPDIFNTLKSLSNCSTLGVVEIIVVVNFPETVECSVVEANKELFDALQKFCHYNSTDTIRFYTIWLGAVRKKFAGAGYARKIGMDEAVHRLNLLDNGNGFIASLDADTLVKSNYLIELESMFHDRKTRQVVIPFIHPKEDIGCELQKAITLYELYLRYFRLSLEYIGWPWSYHTIGSAFAVRASVYGEQGGMNRRNAGEDFYFLNKLFPLGGTQILKNTTVFPAARLSSRVPFGTGPAIKQIIDGGFVYQTYTFQSILEIQYFIQNSDTLFNINHNAIDAFVDNAPYCLSEFWKRSEFKDSVLECNSKCATIDSFRKRLYRKFDAFQIIKFLNFAHESFYTRSMVQVEFLVLLNHLGIEHHGLSVDNLLELAEKLDS